MDLKQHMINSIPGPLLLRIARNYISGQGHSSAIELAQANFEKFARYYADQYLRLVHELQDKNMKYSTISLKPSSMGLCLRTGLIDQAKAKDICLNNIRNITRCAEEDSPNIIGVTIDMEQSYMVDDTLDIYRSLRKDFSNIGTVLQSGLYRTKDDIQNLTDVLGRIRICIGVYQEPSTIAYQDKRSKKRALVSEVMDMLGLGYYVEVATHDTRILDEIIMRARSENVPYENFEFQWLLGVPIKQKKKSFYKDQNLKIRLYIPFYDSHKNAIRYLRRRICEDTNLPICVIRNVFSPAYHIQRLYSAG
jgi:proline dehydrogenase